MPIPDRWQQMAEVHPRREHVVGHGGNVRSGARGSVSNVHIERSKVRTLPKVQLRRRDKGTLAAGVGNRLHLPWRIVRVDNNGINLPISKAKMV